MIDAGQFRALPLPEAAVPAQLRLGFEPIVRSDTGRLVGMDASLAGGEEIARRPLRAARLVRLESGTGWSATGALLEACARAAESPRGLSAWVSLPPDQLARPGVVDSVQNVLHRTRLAPSSLVIQVGERPMIAGSSELISVLRSLRGLGVSVAVEDVSDWYPTLHLHRLPVDLLKMSAALLDDLGPPEHATIAPLIRICHELGITVAAVGVTSSPQADALRALRCDLVQGPYFGTGLTWDQAMRAATSPRAGAYAGASRTDDSIVQGES